MMDEVTRERTGSTATRERAKNTTENFMESMKISFFYNLCARAVFRKDGSLTWFGWLCLLGAGILIAAVLSMFQGCMR